MPGSSRLAYPLAILALSLAVVVLLVLHLDMRRRHDDLKESVTPVVFTFAALRSAAGPALEDAADALADLRSSPIEFVVAVDQSVPVDVTVPIRQDIVFEISESLPIRDEFETTIGIQGPFDTEIPLDVAIPVDIEVPVELTVPVTIDEELPIRADIPFQLDVPVRIDLEETGLAGLIDGLESGITELAQLLG